MEKEERKGKNEENKRIKRRKGVGQEEETE